MTKQMNESNLVAQVEVDALCFEKVCAGWQKVVYSQEVLPSGHMIGLGTVDIYRDENGVWNVSERCVYDKRNDKDILGSFQSLKAAKIFAMEKAQQHA